MVGALADCKTEERRRHAFKLVRLWNKIFFLDKAPSQHSLRGYRCSFGGENATLAPSDKRIDARGCLAVELSGRVRAR